MTAYNPGSFEAWLHCWMLLEIPHTYEELEELKKDIGRMQREFGNYFGFIEYSKLDSFFNDIRSMTDLKVKISRVKYSARATDFGPTCKDIHFSYQREIRFLIGECSSQIRDPKELKFYDGFHDYIHKCPSIVLQIDDQDIPLIQPVNLL